MSDYLKIRQSNTDVRTIALNIDVPQYAVQKLKERLFFTTEKPNKDVILWWKRLVDKTYNISDKGKLLSLIESLK